MQTAITLDQCKPYTIYMYTRIHVIRYMYLQESIHIRTLKYVGFPCVNITFILAFGFLMVQQDVLVYSASYSLMLHKRVVNMSVVSKS